MELTGWVTSFKEEQTKAGKKVWRIGLGGKEWSTFDPYIVVDLQQGLYVKANVAEEQKGQYHNYYFNGYEVVEPPAGARPESAPPQAGTVPPEVWEGKDRAMAMMSAWKTAGDLCGGASADQLVEVAKSLRLVAHMIYADIERARMGGFRVTLEPKQ